MNILFILDPLRKLDPRWDTSLYILREMGRRGYKTWVADTFDLRADNSSTFAYARFLHPIDPSANPARDECDFRFVPGAFKDWNLKNFDLIFIRKEPPFNENYITMTYLLERMASRVPIINHPQGIRNTNEKFGTLSFPRQIPETLVTSSPDDILHFQKRILADVVVKPLGHKGGKGVFLLGKNASRMKRSQTLRKAFKGGKKFLLVQKFISSDASPEKRILILSGHILTAYEKRPASNDFRANLSLGGSIHPTSIKAADIKLVRQMKPYLQQEGLLFTGLDTIGNRLLEINVTCPAGLAEAKALYPDGRFVEKVAEFLETYAAS